MKKNKVIILLLVFLFIIPVAGIIVINNLSGEFFALSVTGASNFVINKKGIAVIASTAEIQKKGKNVVCPKVQISPKNVKGTHRFHLGFGALQNFDYSTTL